MMRKWFKAKVIHGSKLGKTLGFPTINLDNPSIVSDYKTGVYTVQIKIKNKGYKGLFYFGPRVILGQTENILEIFIFDFSDTVYGEIVHFKIGEYIRPVIKFSDFDAFKKQLTLDCQKALKIFHKFRVI